MRLHTAMSYIFTAICRRKLDDANAALHELGRENQSIQVGTVHTAFYHLSTDFCDMMRMREK